MISVKAGNDGRGIIIEIEGEPEAVNALITLLGVEAVSSGTLSKELFGAVFFRLDKKGGNVTIGLSR